MNRIYNKAARAKSRAAKMQGATHLFWWYVITYTDGTLFMFHIRKGCKGAEDKAGEFVRAERKKANFKSLSQGSDRNYHAASWQITKNGKQGQNTKYYK